MPAEIRSIASPPRPARGFAPRLYYFHPLLAGPLAAWQGHLRRAQEMGFDSILMAPIFASGAAGDLFLAADHEHPHTAIAGSVPADQFLSGVAQMCREHELSLYVDVVLGRLAPDAAVVMSAPHRFRSEAPSAERVDPRGDFFRACDGIEVALDDGFGIGQSTLCVSGPRSVTGVKDHLMTLLDEQFACHQAKAG